MTTLLRRSLQLRSALVCLCAVGLAAPIAGCDIPPMAAGMTAGLFSRAQPGFEQLWDYEFAGKSLPGSIMQLEGLLTIAPESYPLRVALIGAYVGYGYGWVEDKIEEAEAVDDYKAARKLRDQAENLYARGFYLAQTLLRDKSSDFDAVYRSGDLERFEKWMKKHFKNKQDGETLLWVANIWGNLLNMRMDDMNTIAQLPFVKAVAARSLELRPGYYYQTGTMLLGAISGMEFPPNLVRSKQLFEEALAATERRSLIIQLNMARYYAVSTGDDKLFFELLNEVVNAEDVLPELRISNVIARRRAERYLKQAPLFFSQLVDMGESPDAVNGEGEQVSEPSGGPAPVVEVPSEPEAGIIN